MISKKDLFELATLLEGIPILGCIEDSPTFRAGIRYGDVLLAINGVPVKSIDDFANAKKLRADGMSGVFFRDGNQVPFDILYDVDGVTPTLPTEELLAKLADKRVIVAPDDFVNKSQNSN